jgi:hypothetical protein
MDAALAALPMAGRRVELQRGELRWSMSVPEDGRLPFDGMFPALIQWHVDVPPGNSIPSSGLTLNTLSVSHPDAEALEARVRPLLDAPMVQFVVADQPGLQADMTHGSEQFQLR